MPEDGVREIDTRCQLANGLHIAYLRWCPGGGAAASRGRILCYPGWLDNAGSFANLGRAAAAHGAWDIVAVDPPGCGKSDRLPASGSYSDYEEAALVPVIARAIWGDAKPFSVFGHSRGANVGTGAAAAFPELISALVLSEAFGGLYTEHAGKTAADHLRLGWNVDKKNAGTPPKAHASFAAAVARQQAHRVFPKAPSTARNLAERGIRPVSPSSPEGPCVSTNDPRLHGVEGAGNQKVYLTKQANDALLAAIRCPVLFLEASRSYLTVAQVSEDKRTMLQAEKAERKRILAQAAASCDFRTVEGSHHFHSDRAEHTAQLVLPWLEKVVAKPAKL
ncbi:hypothetical protein DIPPA_15137 [Diplonema papillatum]|nr:hypothetical protein DIPPA_15137 [Diplonema papillatum]